VFTLDDVVTNESATAYYMSGARQQGHSTTSASYDALLTMGYDRFTTVFYGGRDGLDITEMEAFRNTGLSSGNEYTNYAYNTVKRAIDTVADPEFVEMNLLSMPGLTNSSLTSQMIQLCEDRADALAVLDLDGGYVPKTETTNDAVTRRGDIDTVISNLKNRSINTSYGCAYYPWVRILDSLADRTVWVPPSVVALGTMASSERKSEIWFAPAGFNRGGLTDGSAGLPVVGVTERLTQEDRDDLYESNINPIAKFPAEGIVIFGQKTLQVQRSALDRINVRRLLIFLKKQVSRLSTQVLFDQNVPATWERFKALVNPFMSSVQSRLGITEYKLILDETTTTPDLIDQNVLYAKIFLKPARAIEFIAIDFVVSSTGASFED
jgi:phage tail sheath protein FI